MGAAGTGNLAATRPGGRLRRFLADRWAGAVPLERLFWRDMIVVGTAINVAATGASLALLATEAPLWAALAVHFGPLPYNLFLAFATWRTAERRGGWAGLFCQTISLLWLLAAIVI